MKHGMHAPSHPRVTTPQGNLTDHRPAVTTSSGEIIQQPRHMGCTLTIRLYRMYRHNHTHNLSFTAGILPSSIYFIVYTYAHTFNISSIVCEGLCTLVVTTVVHMHDANQQLPDVLPCGM